MNLKIIGIILIVGLGSFFVGKHYSEPREKIVEKIVYKDKETKVQENKNIKTVSKKYLAKCDPNDAVVPVEETTTTDLSVVDTNIKEKEREKLTVKETSKPNWLIGAGYGYDKNANQTFSGEINHHLPIIPAYVGLQVIGNKENQMGLIKLTVEF